MSTEDICDLVTAVGKIPVERDTLYNEIRVYEEATI
jgi:aminodeoxyfutalosine synthase